MRADNANRGLACLVLLISISSGNFSFAQTGSPVPAEQAVRDAFKEASSGYYTGTTEKNLETLGDAAAIEVIKILAGRDLTSQDIRSSLLVVRMSFAAPRLIPTEADRRPRATLLLLRYLDFQAKEPSLRSAIADASRSLKSQVK
jgi:hypothetical protein